MKYELSDECTRVGNVTLSRIRALIDFENISAGDLGGYVQSCDNLAQEGTCWIYHNSMVFNKAQVLDSAKVVDNALVYDIATVADNAIVGGNSKVFQKALISQDAIIDGYASVYGQGHVFGKVKLSGFVKVHEDAWVYGDFSIDGTANITRKTTMRPIVLSGMAYGVSIMDDSISIDCQTKTFDEWRNITREEAYAMNGRESLRFFKHIPDTLEFLVQKYRNNKSNV